MVLENIDAILCLLRKLYAEQSLTNLKLRDRLVSIRLCIIEYTLRRILAFIYHL